MKQKTDHELENDLNPLHQGTCRVSPSGPLRGTIRVPGDKSISHRAVMLGALAEGETTLRGFLESEDCLATLHAFQAMGATWEQQGENLVIQGRGGQGLIEPDQVIDMGNSGTGSRLLLGILAGQPFSATLTGDASLRNRPMGRVTQPLAQMGARFMGRDQDRKLPMTVRGGNLKAIEYVSPVASAQVKSAILLAGLYAEGTTAVREPALSRDHTERMLKTFGAVLEEEERRTAIAGGQSLKAVTIDVPGDLSSAAFFLAAAAVVPGSDLTIESVGVNSTRTGMLDVLREMGAEIQILHPRSYGAEPVADLRIRYQPLRGVRISGETVVRMIDEFPIFAVVAAYAETPSIVEGAEELRVKESDRIRAIVEELGKMGAAMEERPDGFKVQGGGCLKGADTFSYGDHRIAMSLTVAGLAAKGDTTVRGTAPINTSFPGFFSLIKQLCLESVREESS